MIQLTSYIFPKLGERFATKKVWVNPNLITHMGTYEAQAARDATGKYLAEMIEITSIYFAVREEETQASISVIEHPAAILENIHFWRLREKEYFA